MQRRMNHIFTTAHAVRQKDTELRFISLLWMSQPALSAVKFSVHLLVTSSDPTVEQVRPPLHQLQTMVKYNLPSIGLMEYSSSIYT